MGGGGGNLFFFLRLLIYFLGISLCFNLKLMIKMCQMSHKISGISGFSYLKLGLGDV